MGKEVKDSKGIDYKSYASNEELKSSLDFTKTKTDHVANYIISVLGKMGFLFSCLIVFFVWISWNLGLINAFPPFDPYPFPILELAVSLFAIILSVSVLINQNRQSRIETIRQRVDFEINVRAEDKITKLLQMVHEMHLKLGIESESDLELGKLKETTDVKQIQKSIDNDEPIYEQK